MDFEISEKEFETNWKHVLAEAAEVLRHGGTSLAIVVTHPKKPEQWLMGNIDDFAQCIGYLEILKANAVMLIQDDMGSYSNIEELKRNAEHQANRT